MQIRSQKEERVYATTDRKTQHENERANVISVSWRICDYSY